ncbi:MAG: type III restriction-modification system endonuclease [Flavobacteriales bacterium]
MKGFNFEKNLNHQSQAVDSTVAVFDNIALIQPTVTDKNYINPAFDYSSDRAYPSNIKTVQESNGLDEKINRNSNIIDIMMETGTGKTYTYTKTIFELNKHFGLFKFIVVVPTLSIKAGTIDFLKSDSSREHFKEQYRKTLHLHIVESQKNNKSKKSFLPPAVTGFVNAGNFEKNSIQVMIINAGMISSDTMQKSFDRGLFDKYTVPFDAVGATKPFVIVDEPHKFAQGNKTWENIQKMKPQFILRYGATFQGHENLIYTLTAVDSFNKNLVKGVIGHITEFESGKNAMVKFIDSDGTEAIFELNENNSKKKKKLKKGESLELIHSAMNGLIIENLNKSTVVLSNGKELKKTESVNPYSYAESLQETMIQKAIKYHFDIEKALLTREVKIKPLTLFFIDNIDEYRNKDGYIRKTVEQYIEAEIKELLKTEKHAFYKAYLEKTLADLSATHAGYFSKDNTEKDEVIEKEINEILHDKQALLDLENPRRFIFSKWTLREGWDNPNVFQICKLRSSGSEISKLQEVGRGLRLPVNEYGNRVKDEQFYLNYFVDFTESDFVVKLVAEINEKSGAISVEVIPDKLSEQMIKKICESYKTTANELLEVLDSNNVITRTNGFKSGGFDFVKQNYPRIFEGVNSNQVRKASQQKKNIVVKIEKYQELKELWEKLNEKVILEYKFDKEDNFKLLFTNYLITEGGNFTIDSILNRITTIEIKNNVATANESVSTYGRNTKNISTMKYSDFLKELSGNLKINIKTLHQSILDSGIDINNHLNHATLRVIKQSFNYYLMANAIDKFSIAYRKVSNNIHPTKLTDKNGDVLKEIAAVDVGVLYSDDDVAQTYLFDQLYYDSDLERANIKSNIAEVLVFTKIPKNAIKIPVAGGKSYSPDFAYVLKFKDGEQKLHFIVETKGTDGEKGLRDEEKFKIKHAEKFFGTSVKIEFRKQFSNKKIVDLIKEITSND